jgi:hypothetical protein
MNRLLLVLVLALICSTWDVFGDEATDERASSEKSLFYAQSTRDSIKKDRLLGIARLTDKALDAIVDRAAKKLAEAGDTEYAYWKQSEWKREYSGSLTRMMLDRHIGDHPTAMLSQWLENFYDHTEMILGVEACKMLHISDIKTINCSVKIVLFPCSFPMDAVTQDRETEYRNHFAKDLGGVGELYGLVPVITYWVAEIGLMATGVGGIASFIVAPASEYIMGNWLAPRLANFVFEKSCGSER